MVLLDREVDFTETGGSRAEVFSLIVFTLN